MTTTMTRIESLVLWACVLVMLSLFGLAVSPVIGSLKNTAGTILPVLHSERPAMILPCEKQDKMPVKFFLPKPIKDILQKTPGLEGLA